MDLKKGLLLLLLLFIGCSQDISKEEYEKEAETEYKKAESLEEDFQTYSQARNGNVPKEQIDQIKQKIAEHYEKMGELFEKAGNWNRAGDSYFKLAYFNKGVNIDQTFFFLNKTIELFEKAGNLESMADAYTKLGTTYFHDLGNREEAIKALDKAIALYDKLGKTTAATKVRTLKLDRNL